MNSGTVLESGRVLDVMASVGTVLDSNSEVGQCWKVVVSLGQCRTVIVTCGMVPDSNCELGHITSTNIVYTIL